ncbi:MATE family efflux transporter [Klebsiella aerogenes]|uniref:MATE family efflux transporter n=2 Tax=Klebsiella aerogenes TaxID=548 RepID=UPI001F60C5C6|nr:MATE family efflux transporter [Klebsiella aerogenes]
MKKEKVKKMSKNKLIVKNTLFLATRTIFSLAISFYTTRIVLHQLGVSDYGLFSVIYGVVAFFVFIISAMNDSVQRFISINLGLQDIENIRDTVKNSILVYLLAGICLVSILLLARTHIIYDFLNIDATSLNSAKILYLIALFSIFISVLQTPFNALVLANEKMSFYAYMTIFDACSKLTVSLLIVMIPYQKVIIYSLLLLTSTFFVFCIYLFYCYAKFKNFLVGGKINVSIIKEITVFSFWNVFGNFAYVCRTQGINVIINVFFATTANAAYALSNTVLNSINSLTQSFITAIRPQIFKAYAEKNIDRYNVLINAGAKYTFSLLFILSCPVLLSTEQLLSLWLVNIPEYTVGFVRFVILVALIDSFSSSVITGIQATGRIKKYQVVVGFFVFISFPVTYILYRLGAPIYSVFIPLIITSILNMFLRVYFISSLSDFKSTHFFKSVALPCALSALISLSIGYYISTSISYGGVVQLLCFSSLYSFISILSIFIFVVSKDERKLIVKYFGSKFK